MSETTLLTGITGFVGGALAARLLSSGRDLVALVRADTEAQARARIGRSLSRFLGAAGESHAASVRVLVGDLTDDETYLSKAFDGVTHVAHAAASTSFAARSEVWRVNVEGTKKLAERMRLAPALRRFVHVSTAYCCGDRPAAVVHEDEAPRDHHTHVNGYARSKASAESLLAGMDWGGRLLVARPSVIVGHSELGVGPSTSLFWYYRALAALGRGPSELADRRDIVPVDYVAEALEFVLSVERPEHTTYHISAGSGASRPLGEVLARLTTGSALGAWRKVSAASLARVTPELRELCGDIAQARKLARSLAACARFGEIGVQWFDNTRLLSAGFRSPPSFLDYLDVCVQTSGAATILEQLIDDA